MGDLLGSPRVAPFVILHFSVLGFPGRRQFAVGAWQPLGASCVQVQWIPRVKRAVQHFSVLGFPGRRQFAVGGGQPLGVSCA